MEAKTLRRFSILTTVLLVLTLGFASGVEAQKGHGNGHGGGNGHGNGHGNENGNGNGNGGNGRGGGWGNGGAQPGRNIERQQGGWQIQRPMPQVYQPQIQVQQPRYEIRQQKQAWKQERKQQKFEQRVWGQPQIVVRQRQQGPPPWAGVWTAPGQLKKAERRIYREERKAVRDYARRPDYDRRDWQTAQPVNQYPGVYSYDRRSYSSGFYEAPRAVQYPETYYQAPASEYYPNYYGRDYQTPQVQYYSPGYYAPAPIISGGEYYYPQRQNNLFGDFLGGSNWTEMLLGTVLDALVGGRLNGRGFTSQPSYSSYYGGYSANGGYYGNQGRYGYGTPYSHYSDYTGHGPVMFSYPSSSYDNDEYVDELTRRAYNSGYEDGFLAGQAARYNGYSESAYNDPYFSEDAGYGYGAYSICLNRQRRLLSDGYERGYQDALDQNNIYDAQNGGDVDLVSLMLSSALGMFNV